MFHGVAFGGDRVTVRVFDPADHYHAIGLDLEPLTFAQGFGQRSLDAHGAMRGQVQDLGLIVGQRRLGHNLDRLETRAVVYLQE